MKLGSIQASKWLDQHYPKNGVCKYKGGEFKNFGKRRREITHLDISCHNRYGLNKIKGKLDLEDFVNLVELRCTNNKLNDLTINNLIKLKIINCSSNEFCHLDFEGFPELEEIDCTNNEELTCLTLKNCPNIEVVKCPVNRLTLKITGCYNLNVEQYLDDNKIKDLYINNDDVKEKERLKKINNQLKQRITELGEIITELEELPVVSKKDILIIGRTGSGKSTLANVLFNKNNKNGNFEEVFREDDISESVTTQLQVEETEINGMNYRIIDTVGFGDTGTVTGDKAVLEAVKTTYAVKEGINQILFVVGSRSDIDEKAIRFYNSLKDEIFGENIFKYTTIVRTNFELSADKKRCNEDIKALKKNKLISELANSCNGIIHVNNPSLKVRSGNITERHKFRTESRRVLENHLSACKNVYRPSKLKEVVCRLDRELDNRGIDFNKQLIGSNFSARLEDIVEIALICMPIVTALVKVALAHSCQIT
ncbi:15111_t:CDS:1 [Dentiscutata erythropus]|uniref:15111_t:CDS:1 n=1 Tax=Dentiscutata erythropus TaxID=1348616 RepID=A0A9N9DCZ9_9GLOM|nr:15111_t:CDS:1 [Dentiscutata erythropus]